MENLSENASETPDMWVYWQDVEGASDVSFSQPSTAACKMDEFNSVIDGSLMHREI